MTKRGVGGRAAAIAAPPRSARLRDEGRAGPLTPHRDPPSSDRHDSYRRPDPYPPTLTRGGPTNGVRSGAQSATPASPARVIGSSPKRSSARCRREHECDRDGDEGQTLAPGRYGKQVQPPGDADIRTDAFPESARAPRHGVAAGTRSGCGRLLAVIATVPITSADSPERARPPRSPHRGCGGSAVAQPSLNAELQSMPTPLTSSVPASEC